MGLLDYLQTDPNKQEALKMGLLNAGIAMMANQSPNFLASLGQGAGSGVAAYQKQFDEAKRKAAMNASLLAAQTPAKDAVPESYKVAGKPYKTMAEAQTAASPYMTTLPQLGSSSALMPNVAQASQPAQPTMLANNGPFADMAHNPSAVPVNNETTAMLSPQQDVQMPGQPIETVPGQPAQAGGFDFAKMAQHILSSPDAPPELQNMALKYYASQKPKETTYSTAPQFTGDGRAYVMGSDGTIKFLDGVTPRDKIIADNIGGANIYRTEYSPTPLAKVDRTVSPDASLTDQRTRSEGALNRGVTLRGQNLTDARSRETNAQGNKPPAGYRYKPNGDLEMIPGGPADVKNQQKMEGGGTVSSVVGSLRDAYDQLDAANAVTSTQNRAGTNLGAWAANTGMGQTVGSMFGTKTQALRDQIAQQRPILLQAIMKATGMSSKQMDSNAELKLYLATATDPTKSVQANRKALDMIEKLYGSGAGNASITGRPTAPASSLPQGWSVQEH